MIDILLKKYHTDQKNIKNKTHSINHLQNHL